jgi:hypothetical protein
VNEAFLRKRQKESSPARAPLSPKAVNRSAFSDDERLHSGHAVLGRRGHQGKLSYHHAFKDKVHFAERCRRPLPFENFEEVTVVRLGAARAAALFFSYRTVPYSPLNTMSSPPSPKI